MWAVNLILFSCTGSHMVGDVTQRSVLRQLILGWPQQVHLDSSAAVQEVMLGHLKAWDQGQAHRRAATPLEGLQPWVRLCWSRFLLKGCDHG